MKSSSDLFVISLAKKAKNSPTVFTTLVAIISLASFLYTATSLLTMCDTRNSYACARLVNTTERYWYTLD